MKAAAVVIIAMLLATSIPLSAASEETIPYINIEYPKDGSTVGTKETLEVIAEGKNLNDPSLSITGEQIGVGGPLTGCIYSTSASTTGIPPMPATTKMYCKQEINLASFDHQKVKVSVSVKEETKTLTDSVGLYVSGHCAWQRIQKI